MNDKVNNNNDTVLRRNVVLWQKNKCDTAFAHISEHLLPYVVYYTNRYMAVTGLNPDNRQDMLSEGHLGVINAMANFDPEHNTSATFTTFAVSHIRGRMLKYVDKNKKWEEQHIEDTLDDLSPAPCPNPEDHAITNSNSAYFSAQLATLPETYEMIFVKRAWDGDTFTDIAHSMNISRETVKKRYNLILAIIENIPE